MQERKWLKSRRFEVDRGCKGQVGICGEGQRSGGEGEGGWAE